MNFINALYLLKTQEFFCFYIKRTRHDLEVVLGGYVSIFPFQKLNLATLFCIYDILLMVKKNKNK